MTIKERIIRVLESLPEDASLKETILEAIDRLMVLYKIEYGIAEADAGHTIPNEEAKKLIQRRLQSFGAE